MQKKFPEYSRGKKKNKKKKKKKTLIWQARGGETEI